ncbi:MAG: hypothetical protein MUE60_00755 [Candidatus Eisenbacteria bacterium]|jgi:hypothetical protein|nr:hypothetical protein [Candidatus Eisenbacteria bacterium]
MTGAFALAIVLAAAATGNHAAISGDTDPSGIYLTTMGDLSVLVGERCLAFSYLSVFGPTAHIYDGAGIAREEEAGRFVWADEHGSVAFVFHGDALRLEVEGIASFCGAGWPGDTVSIAARHAPSRRVVAVDQAHFHTVGSETPVSRRAYVVRGDTVEVVPTRHGNGEGFVLARFVGPARTTVGLLREHELAPEPAPKLPPIATEAQ